ncbi:multicopper oxidase family protein [Actinospica robiniae]|uniref:multicopper oxidase family protein n=1 Tax=Actinospica robiniae TaxID=304901 RepID=UPI000555F8DA|nr:multicopper oxidase domain-containing protein [Actinospica robiniae]
MDNQTRISRRAVLKAVPVAAALIASPDGLLAERASAASARPFPQPKVWAPRAAPGAPGRVLERTLDVRFTETRIPGFGTANTRTYNGTIPGPTLRVRGGDQLRLTQINGLPPNAPFDGDHNIPHNFNSFNLHTHGLHVSPSGQADNVMREFAPRSKAGDPEPHYLSVIDIPLDHPAGTFWYHPHLHGSVSQQVSGGMTGVLVVEGDVDEVPEIAKAADVVVCINELKIAPNTAGPLFTSDAALTAPAATYTVNGQVNPTIVLRPGEVQRWRLVCATAFTALALEITGDQSVPTMHQIAQDGITFAAPVATNQVSMAMGNRADILVRADRAGTYELRAASLAKPLMTIHVVGHPIVPPMGLPEELPPGKAPLDDADIASSQVHREVRWHVDANVLPTPFPNAYRVLGSNPTPAADPHGDLTRDPMYGRFDPTYVNHILPLGTVERWVISTDDKMTAFMHPFHLHTNPFLVTHRNGVALDPPVWHDTIGISGGSPGESVTILVKYEDFIGLTMLHCHNLQHEDLGMMQQIDYVEG